MFDSTDTLPQVSVHRKPQYSDVEKAAKAAFVRCNGLQIYAEFIAVPERRYPS
ncbi:hypothetical protein ACFOGG_07955 [Brenneria rubrifaciens]|uniref:hypothetical protein n=1 Tax=Brenneria rubrifaciens TaxID=55213 RepID=UPI0036108806